MASAIRVLALALALVAGAAAAVAFTVLRHGLSARREPTALEAAVATRLRRLAIPAGAAARQNPLPASAEVLAEGREHFADHCAICHANDGSGEADIGRNLYPRAPDMRKEATQSLSDGELFYIIENGVRFTGMPAWGSGGHEDEKDSWELVRFLRHLPELTDAELREMEADNPKSREDLEREEAAHDFLSGGEPAAPARPHHHSDGGNTK
jgi:mono/diheme cytochrome c family protein